MILESLIFEHNGTKVELKAQARYIVGDRSPLFLVSAKITPQGRNPIDTNLRYDSDKCCFIDTLLPWPTPYDNFDRKAFDDGNSYLFPIMNEVFAQLFRMEYIQEKPITK